MTTEEQLQAKQGVLLAIAAYIMWGIAPIYFKTVAHVSALEILSHRVVWSFVFLAVLMHSGRRWRGFVEIFRTKTKLVYMLATSLLIGCNWLVFIWAINANHMLDASLGYYINPLINVVFGMLFLGERLRKMQWLAVFLAACGVLIQLIAFGSVPMVAFALAMTFALYGLLRKKVAVDAQTGLFIETLLLLPVAAIYLWQFADSSTNNMFHNSWSLNWLLIAAGIVTTLPLLCFTGAATRLKLSTLGFFQYIGPSFMFVLAVAIYGETFSMDKAITFAFIWGALLIFSADGFAHSKKKRLQAVNHP
ncbi:EamA family transporter RarD [Vibrio olivae]|uniref:EamA family transporter RarD n=1 Tax=Vibrio olivae TaxID=1243002 RepID=A0ABV5HSW6_9VIBR